MSRSLLTRTAAAVAGIGAVVSLVSCSSGGEGEKLTGRLSAAGASFPAAIYQRWFQDLAPQGLNVNYQSVGSGAGVRQFTAGTVDFGASDKPMKPEATAKVNRGVVQIPMTAGAIAVAYNNPGCELKLSQDQLAGIFLGKIKNFSELGCVAVQIDRVEDMPSKGKGALPWPTERQPQQSGSPSTKSIKRGPLPVCSNCSTAKPIPQFSGRALVNPR